MIVIETKRLFLRHLHDADDALILELLNEPAFLANIGDRRVRTLEDARGYIAGGPAKSYAQHRFGLYLVALKDSGASVGICGLIKRPALDDVDIGFAFLERFWGKGYAHESAAAVLEQGRRDLGLKRVVAVTAPHNQGSIRVLEKIGLRFERMITLPGDEEELKLFASDA